MTYASQYGEDARLFARMDRFERFQERLAKREDAADAMIGELCREGRTVFYVTTKPGRYREAATRRELIDFLIRNRYA